MSKLSLDKPQRQSKVGVAVIFLKNLRSATNFFLAVVVVQFGSNFEMLGLSIWHWGFIIAFIFLIISILQYNKFLFYVKNQNFIIEKGVIRQERLNVPFDRIQTVNTTQNVVQQLFGVVALKIDTAGSAGQEIEINALPKDYAEELQDYLMSKKYEFQADSSENTGLSLTTELKQEPTYEAGQEPLVHLNFKDLLKVGFTENHLRSGLLLFAIINGYLWQFEDYLLKPFEPYLEKTANTIIASWVIMVPLAIIVFLVVALISSLVRVLLRYFNLKFYLSPSGVFMHSGLLKRQEYRIPHQKIQYFKWSSNPLRRIIGYNTVKIKQAGSQEVGDKKTVSIPGLQKRPLVNILKTFYPNRKKGRFSNYQAHPLLALQLFVWFGLIPMAIYATIITINELNYWAYSAILPYLVMSGYFIYKYYQTVQLRINQTVIEIKKGWVYPSAVSIKHYKLQNIAISQTIFQKRRGLATITLHTAAGNETMPHIPHPTALALYNYLIYKIESTQKSWM